MSRVQRNVEAPILKERTGGIVASLHVDWWVERAAIAGNPTLGRMEAGDSIRADAFDFADG